RPEAVPGPDDPGEGAPEMVRDHVHHDVARGAIAGSVDDPGIEEYDVAPGRRRLAGKGIGAGLGAFVVVAEGMAGMELALVRGRRSRGAEGHEGGGVDQTRARAVRGRQRSPQAFDVRSEEHTSELQSLRQ